jgi:cation-transporting ATPase E
MGEGSAAARTVAGLVLENNNFELLPATLEEGRIILRNLRRAGKLFLLKNVYTLFLIIVALGIFKLPFPYVPQQVTLLNALTIGVPVFVIMLGRRPVREPSRVGYLREVGWFAVATGLVVGLAGLTVYLAAPLAGGNNVRMQRTLLLSTLILLGLGNLVRAVAHGERQPLAAVRWVFGWALLALSVYGIAMYVGPVATFFELKPLGLREWGLVLFVAAPALALCLLTDRLPRAFRGSS